MKIRDIFLILSGILVTLASMSIWRHVIRGVMTSATESGVYSMAFVTAPNMEVARKIASLAVEKKLVACVNIVPQITSVYEWEGKIEEDTEYLLMVKTRTSVVPEFTQFVKENHPYDVCEVITSKIDDGNPQYLDWIGKVVPQRPMKQAPVTTKPS